MHGATLAQGDVLLGSRTIHGRRSGPCSRSKILGELLTSFLQFAVALTELWVLRQLNAQTADGARAASH